MISKNELRLGNWIQSAVSPFDGDCPVTFQVSDIIKDSIGIGHRKLLTYEEFNPIPLTEEWLLKFGFEKDEERQPFEQLHYYHPETMLFSVSTYYPSHRLQAVRVVGENQKIIIRERLDYVHQLQNLYFALTGQELEVKESEHDKLVKTAYRIVSNDSNF